MPPKDSKAYYQRRKQDYRARMSELGFTKICVNCREEKHVLDFSKLPTSADGLQAWCKACVKKGAQAFRQRNPNYDRDQQLRKTYGISLVEYEVLYEQQAGVCAICGSPETMLNPRTGKPMFLAVDHDHSTGAIRGLLCGRCNTALGMLRDKLDLFDKAKRYLIDHRAKAS